MVTKSAAKTTATHAKTGGFTAEEKAAMRAAAKERKAQATREEGEAAVREAFAAMPDADRAIAERLHAIVATNAPELAPRTWYGMPAYANSDGKVVCFFTSADKFKSRYATFGFNDSATLDDGAIWPTSFALTAMTPAVEEQIAALVRKAVS